MLLPLLGYLPPNVYELRNHVCLIPCGGLTSTLPLQWHNEQLKYYVKYIADGQERDSLFNGFIFSAIRTRENHFLSPLYVGFGEPSEKTDWQQWIDALFATNANFHALYQLVDDRKLDIWVSVPYPHPSQRHFGVIGRFDLDFESPLDRLTAVDWWLSEFSSRWMEHAHLHDKLTFRGFLWPRDVIDDDDELIVRWTNASIHERKFVSMWLPNYGSVHVTDWRQLGFHVTALHPNYCGNPNFDNMWIHNASLFSRYHQNGMQVTWGKGMIYNDTHHLDYFNRGLGEYDGYMTDSFVVYQFPNQTMESIYRDHFDDYSRLYSFVKGSYQKVNYPGISY